VPGFLLDVDRINRRMGSEVELKQKLRENMDFLKRNTLRLKLLVSELVSCDLLTFDQADRILEQPNHLAKHEVLYTFLVEDDSNNKEPATVKKLRKALVSSGNKHLVDILKI